MVGHALSLVSQVLICDLKFFEADYNSNKIFE